MQDLPDLKSNDGRAGGGHCVVAFYENTAAKTGFTE